MFTLWCKWVTSQRQHTNLKMTNKRVTKCTRPVLCSTRADIYESHLLDFQEKNHL